MPFQAGVFDTFPLSVMNRLVIMVAAVAVVLVLEAAKLLLRRYALHGGT